MVKDHYGRQKGNPLPPHVMPVVVHWLEREIVQWEEGNVLFNNTLNTFYLRLYGIRHMINDHYGRQKGNPLPPHVMPVVVHWLEREIVQWRKEGRKCFV